MLYVGAVEEEEVHVFYLHIYFVDGIWGSLNEPRIIYLSNHYLTILDQEPIIQLLEPVSCEVESSIKILYGHRKYLSCLQQLNFISDC